MPTPIIWGSPTLQASTVSSATQKKIGPAEAGVKASRVLTFAGAGADGDWFSMTGPIGGEQKYTLRTAPDNAVPNEVLIGIDATATATNSKNAVARAAGSYSTSTQPNRDVTATNVAGALTSTALYGGTAGNAIATAKSGADLSWAGATFTGGANPDITIPDGVGRLTVCNPSAKSFVGTQAAPPTELIYLSPDSADVDSGYLVTALSPRTISFHPNKPPTYFVNTPEVGAIPFSVEFGH